MIKQEQSSSQSRLSGQPLPAPVDSEQGNSRVFTKMGHWNDLQKRKYLKFLKEKRNTFEEKDPQKLRHIYREMAIEIGTRKPNQCKLYHKKMEQYYQSTDAIIDYLSQHLGKEKSVLSTYTTKQATNLPQSIQPAFKRDGGVQARPKNEPQSSEDAFRPRKKRLQRKTSLIITQQELEEINKDQQLPKTDQSISYLPSMSQLQPSVEMRRPILSYDFTQVQSFPSQNSYFFLQSPFGPFNPSMFPSYSPVPFLEKGGQNDAMTVFSSLDYSRSPLPCSNNDWLQCHSLFLAWQQRSHELLGRKSGQN